MSFSIIKLKGCHVVRKTRLKARAKGLVCIHDNKSLLREISKNLNSNLPKVCLEGVPVLPKEGRESESSPHENVEHNFESNLSSDFSFNSKEFSIAENDYQMKGSYNTSSPHTISVSISTIDVSLSDNDGLAMEVQERIDGYSSHCIAKEILLEIIEKAVNFPKNYVSGDLCEYNSSLNLKKPEKIAGEAECVRYDSGDSIVALSVSEPIEIPMETEVNASDSSHCTIYVIAKEILLEILESAINLAENNYCHDLYDYNLSLSFDEITDQTECEQYYTADSIVVPLVGKTIEIPMMNQICGYSQASPNNCDTGFMQYDSDDSIADANYIPETDTESDDYDKESSGLDLLSTTNTSTSVNVSGNSRLSPEAEPSHSSTPLPTGFDRRKLEYSQSTGSGMSSFTSESILNPPSPGSEGSPEITGRPSPNQPVKKRPCKKYICYYCRKKTCKFVRHLQLIHKNEEEVKKLLSYPPGAPERLEIINKLRIEAAFQYNTTESTALNQLVLGRRPINVMRTISRKTHLPCPICKVYMLAKSIRRHCVNVHSTKEPRNLIRASKSINADHHREASAMLRTKILPNLSSDHIAEVIRYDRTLILVGNHYCEQYKEDHHSDSIRTKLRQLGRLFLVVKADDDSIRQFTDLIEVEKVDAVINALHKLGSLQNAHYDKPSVPTNVATMLRTAVKIYRNDQISQNKSYQEISKTENFLSLFISKFNTSCKKTSESTQIFRERTQRFKLPTVEELKVINNFLNARRRKLYQELSKKFSFAVWKDLLRYTYVIILTYNRKRPGELQRTLIADYHNMETCDENTEFYSTLSEDEKRLAKYYCKFTITGKRYRTVTVLLDKPTKKCLNLLLQHRKAANVPEDNPYLFGLPSTARRKVNLLFGNKVFTNVIAKSGLKNVAHITPTALRKQLATSSGQIADDQETTHLAKFMGHHKSIHENVYRQPNIVKDVKILPKLLNTANRIDISNLSDDSPEKDTQPEGLGTTGSPNSNTNTFTNIDEPESTDPGETEDDKHSNSSKVQDYVSLSPSSSGGADNEYYGDYDNSGLYYTPNISTITEESINRSVEDQAGPSEEGTAKKRKTSKSRKDPVKCLKQKQGRKRVLEGNVPHRRKRWPTPLKQRVRKIFGRYIKKGRLPSLHACQSAVDRYSLLKRRTAQTIKAWIAHEIALAQKTDDEKKKRSWSSAEQEILKNKFAEYICVKSGPYPTVAELKQVIEENSELLGGRTAAMIKSQLQTLRNRYKVGGR